MRMKNKGLIAQVTDEEEIKELINNGKAVFYIGFDLIPLCDIICNYSIFYSILI